MNLVINPFSIFFLIWRVKKLEIWIGQFGLVIRKNMFLIHVHVCNFDKLFGWWLGWICLSGDAK